MELRGEWGIIQQTSFKHGWFYHYRVHNQKAEKLLSNGFSGLKDYLYNVFENCPNKYFEEGPRGSALKFKISQPTISVWGHEVNTLTSLGLKENEARYNSRHSKVQVFMLENDDKSVAVEVPIWILPEELPNFKKIFKTDKPLTGHIDLLRVEGDKIWVWDYKPSAQKELFATTQVYFYALMLSKRAGIPLENFRCGYFDENYAFIFQPQIKSLPNYKNLDDFQ
ncbi:PD-(D/E)XK nuclease family protein [Candidatus Woesearchaeota archaeon]|nr:PD-(D/E)XK nuclease family protein [Candidatus Woesearchaeota archaeon]